MQKFETLWQPLQVFLNNGTKKKKKKRRRRKIPKIVATFVSACSQGQRTHSARTNSCSMLNEASLFVSQWPVVTIEKRPRQLLPKAKIVSGRPCITCRSAGLPMCMRYSPPSKVFITYAASWAMQISGKYQIIQFHCASLNIEAIDKSFRVPKFQTFSDQP